MSHVPRSIPSPTWTVKKEHTGILDLNPNFPCGTTFFAWPGISSEALYYLICIIVSYIYTIHVSYTYIVYFYCVYHRYCIYYMLFISYNLCVSYSIMYIRVYVYM